MADGETLAELAELFDPAWYLARHPDVRASGLDPLEHYVDFGAAEGRAPCPYFDGEWYLRRYPDVARAGLNPLLHYARYGAVELRDPSPDFDAAWYVEEHPDARGNPLLYHLIAGARAGFATTRGLDVVACLPVAEPAAAVATDAAVDVVIPVYRGLAETRRCIESVLADPARPAGRVIVIDDRSPEPKLSAWLDRLAARGRIDLLRNRRNLGFVGSVNRGMEAAGRNDVVLLNSDTEVPPGWLARLRAAAYRAPDIASVSPFSNNATICSYPGAADAPLAFGQDVAALDDACRAANDGRAVEVPTTVGFCMYVRRAALDDVGGFDAGTFGRGYGEEVDFCQRARRRGWRHMLACDCFVYHRGEVSFGADAARDARVRAVLAERHPDYERDVNNWVRAGLADPARFALTAELMRRSGLPTVLMISHDLGGGVARHVTELGARLAGTAHVLELTPGRGGMRLGVPGLAGHPRLVVPAGAVAGLVRWLRHVGIARVHVHHAMGYGPELRELIRALGVPFDLTVHDYYLLCPQVNLLPRPDAQYCGEPEARACHACLAETPAFGARDIHSWRRAHGWLFQDAARVICPSADAAARVARLGVRVPVVTAPHEVMTGPWVVSAPPLGARGRLRVALLGVLAERKGLAIVTAVLAAAPEWVEFVLIGHPEEELPPALAARLQVTGRYEEDALAGLLARVKPHVAWFPAQWPETYSYTLSAALAAGLPVVAADIGAFPERLRGRPLSWTVSPADGTRAWLDAFATARAALASGRAARAARPVQGVDFYARDYTAPIRKAPLDRKTVRATMRGGRRARRVLLVPERLENGVMSPCAYIRLLQPLDHLGMSGGLEIEIGEAADVAAARADMVLTQRHALADVAAAERLADACRATGARLVYDLDDDLLRAHTTHPEAARITAGAPVVARMLALADEVWVPTPALAARLGRTRRRPRVVENGLDERIFWPPPPPVPPEGPLRLLYMGTATHGADFDMIAPALERLVTTFGARVAVDVIGVRPGALPDWAQRVAPPAGRTASYPAFADWLSRAPRWHIGLAPLVDTEFNRAKSAIKAMDYAALGMPTVASSVGVYDTAVRAGETGLIVANDPDAWFDALAGLVRDPVRRARMARAARARFEDTFCLAAQVPARLAALGL